MYNLIVKGLDKYGVLLYIRFFMKAFKLVYITLICFSLAMGSPLHISETLSGNLLATPSVFEVMTYIREEVERKKKKYAARANKKGELVHKKAVFERMDQLLRSAELLHGKNTDFFEVYSKEILIPLLKFDALTLGRILIYSETSTPIKELCQDINILAPIGLLRIKKLKAIAQMNSIWKELESSFYLEGHPIIVRASGISEKGVRDFLEAIRLIKTSGWAKLNSRTLSETVSIELREGVIKLNRGHSLTGHAAGYVDGDLRTHFVCNVNKPIVDIAKTIIHEDQHVQDLVDDERNDITEVDEYGDEYGEVAVDVIKHSFFATPKKEKPSFLLTELNAYAKHILFQIHLAENDIEKMSIFSIVDIRHKVRLAKQGIRLLHNRASSLSDEAFNWLGNIEELWNEIEGKINPRWKKKKFQTELDGLLKKLLESKNPQDRLIGFRLAILAYEVGKKKSFLKLFEKAISRESSPVILIELKEVFTSGPSSPKLNKLIEKRYKAKRIRILDFKLGLGGLDSYDSRIVPNPTQTSI